MNITRIIVQQEGVTFFSLTKERSIKIGDVYRLEYLEKNYDVEIIKLEARTDYNDEYKQPQKVIVSFREIGDSRTRLSKDIMSGEIDIRDLMLFDLYKVS